MSVRAFSRGAFLASATLFVLSCARPAPRVAAPAPAKPAPPLHQGPLSDFVPSAGVRWLVIGRPREIAQNTWLRPALTRLLPEKRLSAYAQSTGIDLRTLPNALVAGFDFATLYMADLRGGTSTDSTATNDAARGNTSSGDAISKNFERRLLSGARRTSPHPDVRILVGVIGQTPETLLMVRGQLAAVAVGDPTPARIAAAFAQKKLKRSPAVLAGSALSTLPRELETAPLRFYALGPFTDSEWARAGQGLLAAALAVGIALDPNAPGIITATLVLSGDFSGAQSETLARAESAWNEFATSSPGHLFGLDAPAEPAKLALNDRQLELKIRLRVAPIIDGLHAAVSADAWEMLDISRPPSAPAKASP